MPPATEPPTPSIPPTAWASVARRPLERVPGTGANQTGWRQAVLGVGCRLVGTTVMTATLKMEERVRRHARGPVDYDASDHVITAASTALRIRARSPAGRTALFLAVHWGYGSAVGGGYPTLRQHLPRPAALAVFYTGCQAMAMTLFPTLGGTPPPWRWHRSVLISSLAQHAVYAVAVDATDRALCARRTTLDESHAPANAPRAATGRTT